jgi:mono/diheme cytochrome c family protein
MKSITVRVSVAAALAVGLALIYLEVGSVRLEPVAEHRAIHTAQAGVMRRVAAAEMYGFEPQSSSKHGAEIYQAKCSVCHGAELKGVAPIFPALIDVTKRLSEAQITAQVHNGKGRMMAFPDISDDDLHSLYLFLKAPGEFLPADKPGA